MDNKNREEMDGAMESRTKTQNSPIVQMCKENKKILCVLAVFAVIVAGIIGFITFNGDLKDSIEDSDIAYPELRRQYRTNGIIPGVNMLVQDAQDLVLSEPKKVRLTLIQEDYTKMSHNVIAEIKGSEKPEEVITLTAHYDSVKYSTGVYDNGAGSVINMEAYKYFLENKPKRTLKFIWCGSEERGLLGSKAWVLKHEEELKNIKISVNCDVAGPVLGTDRVIVTGNDKIYKKGDEVYLYWALEDAIVLRCEDEKE